MTCICEYISYCNSTKETLKLRDQKQIDHQELCRYRENIENERSKTLSTGKGSGISGFFQDTINDFKGIDPERTRKQRLEKLEEKIKHVLNPK